MEIAYITFVSILGLGLIGSMCILASINWSTHIEMTRKNSRFQKRIGYSKFKSYFNGVKWHKSSNWPDSLWDRNNDCEFHASIIRIGGCGLIIHNPLDFYLVNRYVKKYIENGLQPPPSRHRLRKKKFETSVYYDKTRETYDVKLYDGTTVIVNRDELYPQNKID